MFSRFASFISLHLLVIVFTEDLYSKFNQHDYKLEFTRLEVADFNADLYKFYNVVTFKYNRSVAVANITFQTKVSLHNKDILMLTQIYKFYSNEYRRFPIRYQLNFCTSIASNLLGMNTAFTSCGSFPNDCEFIKGTTYHVCNFRPDPSKFPPMIPSGEYKLEMTLILNNSIGVVLNGYGKIYRPIKQH